MLSTVVKKQIANAPFSVIVYGSIITNISVKV